MSKVVHFIKSGFVFYVISIFLFLLPYLQVILGVNNINKILETHDYIYLVILFFAILETIFLIGFYLPGSLVIAFVASNTVYGNYSELFLYIITVFVGVNLGVICNYFIGRNLSFLVKKNKHYLLVDKSLVFFKKHGKLAVFLLCGHPNYIGTLFTGIGIIKYPIKSLIPYLVMGIAFFTLLWFGLFREFSNLSTYLDTKESYALPIICLLIGFFISSYRLINDKNCS